MVVVPVTVTFVAVGRPADAVVNVASVEVPVPAEFVANASTWYVVSGSRVETLSLKEPVPKLPVDEAIRPYAVEVP
jgi:hypothetical protein